MTRSERYKRALAMTNRVYELGIINKWSPQETSNAVTLLDEGVPMHLHAVGELIQLFDKFIVVLLKK